MHQLHSVQQGQLKHIELNQMLSQQEYILKEL